MTIEISRVIWKPSWRLVPSRFPPIGLFDRVTSSDDLEVILDIEGLTNDRLREDIGLLHLIPENERRYGPGTTPIMAAFTHLKPDGSRFSDGSYGVYYAAKTIDTAVAETLFHRARFLASTNEPEIEVDMRGYASNIDALLHDIRNQQEDMPDIYQADPDLYSSAQQFARDLRNSDSNGIVYSSMRDPGGECVAIFRPSIPEPVVQGAHYCFVWNGERMTNVYIKKEYPG